MAYINISAAGGAANISGIEIWTVNAPIEGRLALVTAAEDERAEDPDGGLKLSAHPNPFSEEVNVEFSTAETGPTQLALFDTRGINLKVLYEGNMLAGEKQSLKAEADDLVNGVYILRLMNGKQIRYLKLMIAH